MRSSPSYLAVLSVLCSCIDEPGPNPIPGSGIASGLPFQVPDAYTSRDGVLHLRVRATEVEKAKHPDGTINGRTYKGIFTYETEVVDGQGTKTSGTASSYIGPEWRVQPGDKLIIDYINDLDDYKFVARGEEEGGCADHLYPQPLNLHTHGLVVSPAGNADNILLSIPPRRSNRYEIDIPSSQHHGLYWYHPHIHGLTDDQVYGGLAGHIVVGRADGDYEEFDGLPVVPMMIRYNVAEPGDGKCNAGKLIDASSEDVHGTALTRDGGAMIYTVNGLVAPSIPLRSADASRGREAESQIWAISNITGSGSYIVAFDEVDVGDAGRIEVEGSPRDIVIVSIDGSPMPEPIVLSGEAAKNGYHVPQGGRVAILVQGASSPSRAVRMLQVQNRSGSGKASANKSDGTGIGGFRDYTRDLFAVGVDDPARPSRHVETPAKLTPRYEVEKQTIEEPVDRERYFVFHSVAPPTADAPNDFPINEGFFPGNRLDQPRVGTVERWIVQNESSLLHPFHFHTQYGQAEKVESPLNGGFDPDSESIPDESMEHKPYPALQYVTRLEQDDPATFTQDVVDLPPARVGLDGNPETDGAGQAVAPGRILMRIQLLDYLGTYVEHCHRLPHEDRGMMTMVRSIPHDPVIAATVPGGAGTPSTVRVVRARDQQEVAEKTPFPGFEGSLFAAVGDVDGDTVPDLAVATGAGEPLHIIVYSGKKDFEEPVPGFEDLSVFEGSSSGASLALADLNGDHHDDLVVGEGDGGSGRVAVFDATTGALIEQFSPYGADFHGSVQVAAGMVEEGGRISLFTAPGKGRAAEVKMFNYDLFGDAEGRFPDLHASLTELRREVATFDGAEDPDYTGGLSIAIGYPRARFGGFANLVTSKLAGQAEVRLFTLGAHDHGGGMVTATGVHKAVAYSPDAMRMATRVAMTKLEGAEFAEGAWVGFYSVSEEPPLGTKREDIEPDGAVLLTAPANKPGPVVTWTLTKAADAFEKAKKQFEISGSTASGI